MNSVSKAIKIATRVLEKAAAENDRVMVFEKGTDQEDRMSISEAINVLNNYGDCIGIGLKHKESNCTRCIRGWEKSKEAEKRCRRQV